MRLEGGSQEDCYNIPSSIKVPRGEGAEGAGALIRRKALTGSVRVAALSVMQPFDLYRLRVKMPAAAAAQGVGARAREQQLRLKRLAARLLLQVIMPVAFNYFYSG